VHAQFWSNRLELYCQVTIWPSKHKIKTPSQAITRSKQIYRTWRSLKFCGTVYYCWNKNKIITQVDIAEIIFQSNHSEGHVELAIHYKPIVNKMYSQNPRKLPITNEINPRIDAKFTKISTIPHFPPYSYPDMYLHMAQQLSQCGYDMVQSWVYSKSTTATVLSPADITVTPHS